MSSEFTLRKEPNLRNPRLIIGLPDVGYAGLRVIDHLVAKLGAEELGHIAPNRFSAVPWVSVKNGVIENLELLRNRFYFWKNTGNGNDLVLFRSEQPTARPYEYVEAILDAAEHVGVKRMYLVGSFGATSITHRETVSALGVVNMSHLTQPLLKCGVELYPEYKGIGTIHSSLLWFARARKLEALGLWAPMPHYVARLAYPWSSYPRASLCLVQKLNDLEGLDVGTAELESLARHTENEMAKIYDQLQDEAKNEVLYAAGEQPPEFSEGDTAQMGEDDLRGTISDIEDFFRKGRQ